MRVDKITMKGITRFTDEVSVDLAALGPGLVALAGKNGAGKTTCLEAAFAGLHLESPTRPGPLHQICNGKDARIELELHNGAELRTVVAVDAVLKSPKTEAFLFNGSGDEPITDGKVGNYREAIAERFGTPRLMLSAALSAQNRRGEFLSLSKADRKDLLAEILDTEGLQDIAAGARERAKALESELMVVETRISAAANELERLGDDNLDVDALKVEREQLEVRIAEDRESLAELREKHGRIKAELDALESIADRLGEAAAKAEKFRQQIATFPDLRVKAGERLREAEEALSAARLEAASSADDLVRYEAAEASLDALRAKERELQAKREEAEATLRERQEDERADKDRQSRIQQLRDALARLERSAGILPTVPCGGTSEYSGCRFLVDAKDAEKKIPELTREIAELDRQIVGQVAEWGVQEARAEVQEVADEIKGHRSKIDEAASLAAKAPAARLAGERLEHAEKAFARAKEEHSEKIAVIDERNQEIAVELEAVDGEICKLREKIESADSLRSSLDKITADGRVLKGKVEEDERRLSQTASDIIKAEERQKRRTDLEASIHDLTEQRAKIGADGADWKLLERAFGRDGIQALEIDAAGPDLSGLTNDLLHACFGERFQVTFVTQVPMRSGGMKEVFDVEVLDHERGREGSVDSLSGGEKTIISEAISLALAIYVAKHSGHRFETLFRDETAGALDPENAERYIRMLRRARSLAGAHQVVFIAQQPAVWEQADAVLWVADGRVEVKE